MDFMPIFATRLKKYRKKRGLSQVELAEAVEVTSQTISGYETFGSGKNSKTPTLHTAVSIAQALDVPLDYLCGMISNPKLQKIKTYADAVECLDELMAVFNVDLGADDAELRFTIKDEKLARFMKVRKKMLNLWDKGEIDIEMYFQWHDPTYEGIKDIEIQGRENPDDIE